MSSEPKPILVSRPRARRLIDVGDTKFSELVKAGKIEMVNVGGRGMVVYASLEKLAEPISTKTRRPCSWMQHWT